MKIKDEKRKGTSQASPVVDPARRRIIKGTAAGGALAGTGLITGFPYVHASEGITLRYMATGGLTAQPDRSPRQRKIWGSRSNT